METAMTTTRGSHRLEVERESKKRRKVSRTGSKKHVKKTGEHDERTCIARHGQ